jgi:hypothetical protein
MEAMCFSETSVDFQRTTRQYIPEDSALHNHRCENFRSYIAGVLLVNSAKVRNRGDKMNGSAGEKRSRSGHSKVFLVFNVCDEFTNVMESANFQTIDELCTRCP